MRKPWEMFVRSHERALANAHAAATELSRARVERVEIELYVERRNAARSTRADRPA